MIFSVKIYFETGMAGPTESLDLYLSLCKRRHSVTLSEYEVLVDMT